MVVRVVVRVLPGVVVPLVVRGPVVVVRRLVGVPLRVVAVVWHEAVHVCPVGRRIRGEIC